MTESDYYHSHQKLSLIGSSGQQLLRNAKILVIGAGGLGCPCLVYLTGCGIGTIGIADFDTISISNLHRQILYNFNDTGQSKTTIAIERLKAQNPFVIFKEHAVQVNENNILSLIENYDIIIDGTDNFLTRYLINDACVYLNKPLVYGAIHQTEGHLTVLNHLGSPTLRCLFPEPSPEEYIPGCAEIGAYNITTGIIGTMMANEAIKIILKNTETFSGKLVCLDIISGKVHHLSFTENPKSRKLSKERFLSLPDTISLSPDILFSTIKDKPFHLIDVREQNEREESNATGIHLPMSEFENHTFSSFLPTDIIIIYCQKGNRSVYGAKYFRKKGFFNTFSLQGGIKSLNYLQSLLNSK